jgi:hypothetical protein
LLRFPGSAIHEAGWFVARENVTPAILDELVDVLTRPKLRAQARLTFEMVPGLAQPPIRLAVSFSRMAAFSLGPWHDPCCSFGCLDGD